MGYGTGKDKGFAKVKNRKIIYGVGINDFSHSTILIKGKSIPEYVLWNSMLLRCYSEKHHIRQPSYKDCYVEEYFHSFTNFYNFIHTLHGYGYIDNKGKPFQLDKDILFKNNILYSRKTICFVPQEINAFLTLSNRIRGDYLIGVNIDKRCKSTFYSNIKIDNKRVRLGVFKTEMEAHLKYKEAKEQQAKVLAERWKDKIDERVYNALMNYTVEITD